MKPRLNLLTMSAILCAASCANRGQGLPPAPTSLQVDVEREVVEIPPAICPTFGGWLAMTENAARAMVLEERKRETEHQLQFNGCDGARRLAELQRDQNADALARASWWDHYGPSIVVGVGFGALVSGVAAGVVLGRSAPHYWPGLKRNLDQFGLRLRRFR